MPEPIAICIEDLGAVADTPRYISCTALAGGEPGLGLDTQGELRWLEPDVELACQLWVSADDRLILLRPHGAVAVGVSRGGRSLEVPEEKPVVLLDGDQLDLAGRRLRVHVHGPGHGVYAPEPLQPEEPSRLGSVATTAAAAALALSTALGAGGCPATPTTRTGPDKTTTPVVKPDAAAPKKPPIEVRSVPPAPPRHYSISCPVTKLVPGKKKSLLYFTCPEGSISVGSTGYVMHPKTRDRLPGSTFTVTKVKGDTIVAETQLQDLSGAKKVWVVANN